MISLAAVNLKIIQSNKGLNTKEKREMELAIRKEIMCHQIVSNYKSPLESLQGRYDANTKGEMQIRKDIMQSNIIDRIIKGQY
jgi:hypothetical protein